MAVLCVLGVFVVRIGDTDSNNGYSVICSGARPLATSSSECCRWLEHADVADGAAAHGGSRALAEKPVEFVDEEVDGIVGILRGDRGGKVGTGDLDATLGGEDPRVPAVSAFDVHAKAEDFRFVPEESFGFGFDRGFHGLGEPEVNTAEDELGVVGAGGGFHGVFGMVL